MYHQKGQPVRSIRKKVCDLNLNGTQVGLWLSISERWVSLRFHLDDNITIGMVNSLMSYRWKIKYEWAKAYWSRPRTTINHTLESLKGSSTNFMEPSWIKDMLPDGVKIEKEKQYKFSELYAEMCKELEAKLVMSRL